MISFLFKRIIKGRHAMIGTDRACKNKNLGVTKLIGTNR
jgi:hypothetical protein